MKSLLSAVTVALITLLSGFIAPWASAAVPTVVTRTLPNGHQLYIVENHQQAAVTLDTWVNVGSVNETAPINGVSHFLEHLLFKGTPQWPTGTIDKWLDSRGAGYNAATSQDFTHYYITVAKPFFAEALGMHAQMLQHSNFPTDELDRERLVVQEEINRAHNRPGHRLFEALQAVLYKGHPYEQTTLGPKAVIAGVPRQAIMDYWCQWYQPSQLKTVLVGDITPDEAEAAVVKAFGQSASPDCKQNTTVAPAAIANIGPLTQPVVSILPDPGVRQVYGMLAFVAPPASNWQAAVALDAAMDALGGGQSSRLYQRLRNKEQLVQDISAANMTQRYGGALYISFETSPDKVKPTLAAILEEVNRLTAQGITAEELASYQHQTARSFIFQAEQTDALASSIGYNVAIGSVQDYTEYLPRLQGLTLAQVKAASRQWLLPQQSAFVAVAPQGDQPALAATDFKAMLTQPVARLGETGQATADDPNPLTTVKVAPPPPVSSKILPNGVTLIAKPLPQAQTVTLQLLVKGGQRTQGKPGTEAMMVRLLNAGPASRTEADWLKLLESQSLGLSAGAGKDEWTLSATAAKEDVGELLMALRELLARPAMSALVFDRERALMAKDIAAAQDEPLSLAMEKAQLALYPSHPYGHVGQRVLQALPTLTHGDVVRYFNQSFQPGNVSAIVAGDFDSATMQAFLSSLPFPTKPLTAVTASAKGPSAKPVARPASVKPPVATLKLLKSQVIETRKPSQAATWLVQSWLAPPATSADYPALKVLSTLLGGGMSSRLFVELREKQGLAYAVGSQYGGSYDPGVFAMYIGTDPKNEAAVKAGFAQQVKRLKAGEVSAAEMQAAKDQIVGKFALAHETPGDHARYLGTYESVGLGYAYDEQFPQAIAAVTLADVVRVANTYLGAPSITSLVGPTKPKTP